MNRLLAPSLFALTAALLGGCGVHHAPLDSMSWDTQPRVVEGDIRVVPAIVVAAEPEPLMTGMIGEELVDGWAEGRRQRAEELAELPHSLRAALPGALHAQLPDHWQGHFRDGRISPADRAAISRAAQGRGSLERSLAQAAATTGGDATLFVWVVHTDGQPLTNSNLVGELVMEGDLPVMVDYDSEPFRVQAELGVALVAADGELLFRYQDEYKGLLSANNPLPAVSRQIARSLVGDVASLWLGPDDMAAGSTLAELD